MKYENFVKIDEIKEKLKNLAQIVDKLLPNRIWTVNIHLWQDGDYCIEFSSGTTEEPVPFKDVIRTFGDRKDYINWRRLAVDNIIIKDIEMNEKGEIK